jgi:hypothetical protein
MPRDSDIIQASTVSGESPAPTSTNAAVIATVSSSVTTATAGAVAISTSATSTRSVAKRESKSEVKSVRVPSNVLATADGVKVGDVNVSPRAAVLSHKVR